MYVAFGGNITSVTRALMVLGIDAVDHLVVGLKLVDHFHQSAPRRIDAKLELNRTLLSGAVACQLTEHKDLRSAEEAVVCTLCGRSISKLLVTFYLEHKWDLLRRKAASENIRDAHACAEVLGVTFDKIGLEAADRWRLPETIREGMRATDPAALVDESVPKHVRWLPAISNYSTEVADALILQNVAVKSREAVLSRISERYSGSTPTPKRSPPWVSRSPTRKARTADCSHREPARRTSANGCGWPARPRKPQALDGPAIRFSASRHARSLVKG